MTRPVVASIVEGHGEVEAVPELLRRIARERFGREIDCLKPHRVPRANIPRPGELGRALRLQVARAGGRGGVVVILDADDDDPARLRRDLQAIADDVAPGAAVVVVAVREFEAWFLAAVESLRSHRSVRDDATYPGDPESRRDAKGELQRLMTEPYGAVRHQVAFCAYLDLEEAARRSPSFASLIEAVGRFTRS